MKTRISTVWLVLVLVVICLLSPALEAAQAGQPAWISTKATMPDPGWLAQNLDNIILGHPPVSKPTSQVSISATGHRTSKPIAGGGLFAHCEDHGANYIYSVYVNGFLFSYYCGAYTGKVKQEPNLVAQVLYGGDGGGMMVTGEYFRQGETIKVPVYMSLTRVWLLAQKAQPGAIHMGLVPPPGWFQVHPHAMP